VGVVVRSVEQTGYFYADQMGMLALGPPVQDDLQRVIVQFWAHEGESTSIELIQPIGDQSPVASFLRKGGGPAHLCYEIDDLKSTLERAQQEGGVLISGPLPAIAFSQRLIAFVLYRDIGMIEYLEKRSK